MVYFLERIAKLLYTEHLSNIRNQCLVFPNRRAGLYFLKYFASQLDKPSWTPAILTINEFFCSFSNLVVAENETLLYELYKVYRDLNKSAESFDEFYFWGDMLINDFDDIDKYMTDASVVFRNIYDFKKIDSQFGEIDTEQAEIIKKFWKNFEPHKQSPEKERFKAVWSILISLYSRFRDSLRAQNLAYEGMVYRDVSEAFANKEKPGLKWEIVHFIGFNALNNCEFALMRQLQKLELARFYWDYDNSYINKGKLNSAGYFLSRNLEIFGNDMPDDWNYDTLLSGGEKVVSSRIIETSSDVLQVKLLPYLINQIPGLSFENAHHTAIILADENLIIPLLTSLPSDTFDINVSMGYPLKMTIVYNLVKHIFDLQRNSFIENGKVFFRFQDVSDILNHQLIRTIIAEDVKDILSELLENNLSFVPENYLCRSDFLKIIFTKTDNPGQISQYLKDIFSSVFIRQAGEEETFNYGPLQKDLLNEFIYSVMKSVNRLDRILDSPDIHFKNETYLRILDKTLKNYSVPFSGEPLSGIQVLGFLESRALDFKNIIFLSVNEGVLPSVSTGSSFIPFTIRQAFGLPVINHQESVYAYHFYRLLHRAQNVTFIYNSDSNGLRTGEMSRFLIQMKYEQIGKPEVINLDFDIRKPVSIKSEIQKTIEHINILLKSYINTDSDAVLSPTAINTWLGCRMKFYYRYVNRLKEPSVIASEIDHALFGQILHTIMKNIYYEFINREITNEKICSLIKNEDWLLSTVDTAISETYSPDSQRYMQGYDIIKKDILFIYLKKILNADLTISPFKIIELEKQCRFVLSFNYSGENKKIKIGGNIDRIDELLGVTRIVDYKTGESSGRINSIFDLFEDDRKKDLDGWLQTLLYCEAYTTYNESITLRPSIYRVKDLSPETFSDFLEIRGEQNSIVLLNDYKMIREDFKAGLQGLISAIFSLDEPFRMTENPVKCNYCPYRQLCQR